MGKDLFTTAQFIEAIPGSGGIITTIAKRIGCSWNTAYKYIHAHPTVEQAYQDEREAILDMAEGTLYKSINAGDTQDAKWLLSRLGKNRGFVERQELTGADNDPIKILVEYVTTSDADTEHD